MKELLGAKIPLFGQWYDVIMVDDHGVLTLSPGKKTAKEEKRGLALAKRFGKKLTFKKD